MQVWSIMSRRALIFCLFALPLCAAVMTDQEPAFTLVEGPQLAQSGIFDAAAPMSLTNTAESAVSRVVSLLFVGSNTAAARVSLQETETDLMLSHAWFEARRGRYDTGLSAAREIKLRLPFDPRSDLLAGYCFHGLGQVDHALRAFEAAGQHASAQLATIKEYAGLLLQSRGDISNAIPFLTGACAARPGDAALHARLGDALFLSGRYDEAAQQHGLALKSEPLSAEFRNSYGASLLMAGRADEAMRELRVGLRNTNDLPRAVESLALKLEKAGHTNAAAACRVRLRGTMP